MLFSITIDCDNNGKLSLWYQQKEKLTTKEQEKLNELKARIERIVRSEITVKEFEFKNG